MASTVKRKPLSSRINNEAIIGNQCYRESIALEDHISGPMGDTVSFEDGDADLEPERVDYTGSRLDSSSVQSEHFNERQSIETQPRPPSNLVEYVSWGFDWQKPLSIFALLLLGFLFSFGHHLYYRSLNNTTAGDEHKQAWHIRFGTLFAFFVVTRFHAMTAAAFGQCTPRAAKRALTSIENNTVAEISIGLWFDSFERGHSIGLARATAHQQQQYPPQETGRPVALEEEKSRKK
ncbi:hypothetical protein LHYA1_G001535 [Lachnellula hyalina]|uniref:Uncharacterized protein n=1 Tax=Lachnellula hyalina TaxID=1316788 RepID=A0A8H8R9C9_9HELO|nr:uncharacterized protein LHYA1_G001535 [Lachnellula hyalina]TVY30378.1 hypothetical protein LHYA1_G001535 [Lachnellula hyalina]